MESIGYKCRCAEKRSRDVLPAITRVQTDLCRRGPVTHQDIVVQGYAYLSSADLC